MAEKVVVPLVVGAVVLVGIIGLLLPGERSITGNFAMPSVREYGGSVHSVGYGQARAFPGRAVEAPPPAFDCYQCSCPDGKIQTYNAGDLVSVSKACEGFCAGGKASFVHRGGCA
jgi:hypothetical protein